LQLLSQLGDWDSVRGMLQREAAHLDPRSSEGMTYGEALLRLDHPEQARVMFQRAVLLDPGNRYARMMLGEAQLASGDAAAAFDTLEPLTRGLLVLPRELALAAKAADAAGYSETFEMTARLKSAPYRQQVRLGEQATDAVLRQDWPGALAGWEALLRHGEDAEVLRRAAFAAAKSGKPDLAAAYAARAERATNAAPDP
jgi:tetratricopeptide (TPR) repeat protein